MYIPGTCGLHSQQTRGWGGQTQTAGALQPLPTDKRLAHQGRKPGLAHQQDQDRLGDESACADRSLCGHQACHLIPQGLVLCKSGPSLLSYRSTGLLYRGPGAASRARTPESGTCSPRRPPRWRPLPVAYRKRRPADAAREAWIR